MQTQATDPMHAAAEQLAQRGFDVFPVGPTRVPFAGSRGFYDASRSKDRVFELWRAHPGANIAIRTGKTQDGVALLVIDIDPRNEGPINWSRLVAGREVPDTLRSITGRDGTHLYFLAPLDSSYPKELASGVDVKCEGGYVVAPPSSHEAGHPYAWENWDTQIAWAPDWLVAEVRDRARESQRWEQRLSAGPVPEAIVHGGRDVALTSVAGKLRRIGLTAPEILASLREVNTARCKPPLNDNQVVKIANSIGRYEPAEDVSAAGAHITYVTATDLAKPLPPVDYISEALGFPAGGGAPHCFGGFGFSGKTVIAQGMNLALASGHHIWRAFKGPTKALRVSHVDNEQGIALTTRRYQRLAFGYGLSLEEIGDSLRLFTFPKLRNGNKIYLCQEHRNAWQEMMDGRDMLVVDSFAASRSGAVKENEAEVRRSLDLLTEISEETKCRPVVIHHAIKGDTSEMDPRHILRGSGALFDAFDSVYVLMGSKGEPVKVEQIKARSHGESIEPFAVVIADVADAHNPKTGLVVNIHGVELIDERRAEAEEAKRRKLAEVYAKRIAEALSGGKRLSRSDAQAASHLNSSNFGLGWTLLMERGEGNVERIKIGKTWVHLHFVGRLT